LTYITKILWEYFLVHLRTRIRTTKKGKKKMKTKMLILVITSLVFTACVHQPKEVVEKRSHPLVKMVTGEWYKVPPVAPDEKIAYVRFLTSYTWCYVSSTTILYKRLSSEGVINSEEGKLICENFLDNLPEEFSLKES